MIDEAVNAEVFAVNDPVPPFDIIQADDGVNDLVFKDIHRHVRIHTGI